MAKTVEIIFVLVKALIALHFLAFVLISMGFESEANRNPSNLARGLQYLAMVVAFIPFPTAFIPRFFGRKLAALHYGWFLVLVLCAVTSLALAIWSENYGWNCEQATADAPCSWTLSPVARLFEGGRESPSPR